VTDLKMFQDLDGMAHGFPIRPAAHHNGYFG
jgi:hypothetical protein